MTRDEKLLYLFIKLSDELCLRLLQENATGEKETEAIEAEHEERIKKFKKVLLEDCGNLD